MQKDRKEGKGNNISVTQRVLDKFGDNATHGRRSSFFDSSEKTNIWNWRLKDFQSRDEKHKLKSCKECGDFHLNSLSLFSHIFYSFLVFKDLVIRLGVDTPEDGLNPL